MIKVRKHKFRPSFDDHSDDGVGGHFGLAKALFWYVLAKVRWDMKDVRLEICPDPVMRWWYVLTWNWRSKEASDDQ